MKLLIKILAIALMALYSFNLNSASVTYELVLDFGGDYVFIHETNKDLILCEMRAKQIMSKEKVRVKAYCIRREW